MQSWQYVLMGSLYFGRGKSARYRFSAIRLRRHPEHKSSHDGAQTSTEHIRESLLRMGTAHYNPAHLNIHYGRIRRKKCAREWNLLCNKSRLTSFRKREQAGGCEDEMFVLEDNGMTTTGGIFSNVLFQVRKMICNINWSVLGCSFLSSFIRWIQDSVVIFHNACVNESSF